MGLYFIYSIIKNCTSTISFDKIKKKRNFAGSNFQAILRFNFAEEI